MEKEREKIKQSFTRLILFLFLALNLSSCGSYIKFSQRFCQGKGQWGRMDKELKESNKDIKLKKISYAFFDYNKNKEVQLRKLLKEKKIDCNQVDSFSVGIKRDWVDALFSLIPFAGRTTLEISANYYVKEKKKKRRKKKTKKSL